MNQASKIKHIIAVAAGKGGVGKSTVAVNVARALSNLGAKVGILDADIYGPSIGLMMKEEIASQHDGEWILPARAQKIKLMTLAYFGHHDKASVIRAPIANAIIHQFIHEVSWGELDYLIIDFPPGTGDVHLTLLQEISLTGALLVTTPQQVALLDVKKALEMFVNMKVPILGLVENMSFFEDPLTKARHHLFGQEGGKLFAKKQGLSFLAEIPVDPLISDMSDHGQSILEMYPTREASKVFMQLATDMEIGLFRMKFDLGEYLDNFQLVWSEGK